MKQVPKKEEGTVLVMVKQEMGTSCWDIESEPDGADDDEESAEDRGGDEDEDTPRRTSLEIVPVPSAAAKRRSFRGTVAVRTCDVCCKKSNDVRWFETLAQADTSGEEVHEAVGDVCWSDGWTCTAYPKLTVVEVATKLREDADFKAGYLKCKALTELVCLPHITPASVTEVKGQGIEVYTKLGFVKSDVFAAQLLVDPEKVKAMRIVKLPIPQGDGFMTGVLVQRHLIPNHVPCFVVKLSAKEWVDWGKHNLTAAELVRPQQARETWEVKCDKMAKKQPVGLRLNTTKDVDSWAQLVNKVKEHQVALERVQAEREANLDNADLGAAAEPLSSGIRRLVGGRAGSDDEAEEVGSKLGRGRASRTSAPGLALGGGRGGGSGQVGHRGGEIPLCLGGLECIVSTCVLNL